MIEIYTDGACRNNGAENALGAYAYRLIYKDKIKDFAKAVLSTTNNQMELTAVIEALKALKRRDLPIIIYSDSTYIVNGATEWLKVWRTKNYKNVKNSELWQELDNLLNLNISFKHISGHTGNIHNEAVDKLCNKMMDKYKGDIL